MSDTSTVPAPPRAAILFILITVLLDMLSFGIVIPVLPKLVEGFLSGDTAKAAVIYGLMGTAWALMQFICAPIQGALSDRFGRRPVVLLADPRLGPVRAVGPCGAAASRVAVESRIGPRLYRDGAGAERRLAYHRPDDFWHRIVQFQYCWRLYRGRDAGGAAGSCLRQDRHGLRPGFRLRASVGRVAGVI